MAKPGPEREEMTVILPPSSTPYRPVAEVARQPPRGGPPSRQRTSSSVGASAEASARQLGDRDEGAAVGRAAHGAA